jgi:hypothetical protein
VISPRKMVILLGFKGINDDKHWDFMLVNGD